MQSMRFSEWTFKWLEAKKPFVKESTLAAYTNIVVTHLLPKFKDFDLNEVTEEVLQEYAIELVNHGRLDCTGGMAVRSVKGIIVVLKNILRDAMRQKVIGHSSFSIRFPNTGEDYRPKVISRNEQQKLVQAIYKNLTPLKAGILLALNTGLRIGEISALKWNDIRLDDGILLVRHTLQRIYVHSLNGTGKSHINIGTPKTKTSVREVPLSSVLLPVLKQLKPTNEEAFFLSGTEKCIEVRTFREFFKKYLQENNIEEINFHALRHTFASRCIEAGADCKTVSEILGHSTVALTMNLYVHPQPEQKRKCVELLASLG